MAFTVEVITSWAELKAAVASATAAEPLSILFAADIEMEDSTTHPLVIPVNTIIGFDMQDHKMTLNHSGASSSFSAIFVSNGAKLSIEDGTIELNASGDGSWRYYTNTITGDGRVDLTNTTVINNCSAGICSCIDTCTGGIATMTGGALKSGRYGVRVWAGSATKQSYFAGRDVTIEANSTGLFLQNPNGGNTNALGLIHIERCKVNAGRSAIYVEDDSSIKGSGTNLQVEIIDSTVVGAEPSGSDKWVEGAEGYVTYDSSTVGSCDHIVVTIKKTEPAKPASGRAYNKAHPHCAFPKFAAGRT